MKKLNETKASAVRHVMVYGPPKSGKTLLVGKLAKEYNLIWFDLESGIDTLFQLPIELQEKITVVSIPDTRTNPVAADTLIKVIRGTKTIICDNHGKVSCSLCAKDTTAQFTELELNTLPIDTIVVFDSITQFTASSIARIAAGHPEDYKFEFDEWTKLGTKMDMFFSHVQNAPYNVVCISHENEVKVEDGKVKIVPVVGTTNYSRNSAKFFSDVIYTSIVNAKHKAGSSTLFSPNKLTGTRSGISIESLSEPDLLPIFQGKIPESIPQQSQVNNQTAKLEELRAKLLSEKQK